jgi:hypothetical protein
MRIYTKYRSLTQRKKERKKERNKQRKKQRKKKRKKEKEPPPPPSRLLLPFSSFHVSTPPFRITINNKNKLY